MLDSLHDISQEQSNNISMWKTARQNAHVKCRKELHPRAEHTLHAQASKQEGQAPPGLQKSACACQTCGWWHPHPDLCWWWGCVHVYLRCQLPLSLHQAPAGDDNNKRPVSSTFQAMAGHVAGAQRPCGGACGKRAHTSTWVNYTGHEYKLLSAQRICSQGLHACISASL